VRGQRVLVVGASGAIGGAVADELLDAGALLAVTARAVDRLASLAERGALVAPFDLARPDDPPALAETLSAAFGGALDGVVVAAGGYGPIGATRSVPPAEVARALDENVVGVLRLVQALAPLLDAGRAPSLVLLSGGGATGALPRYTAYALSKVATVRLVENLAAEEPGWKVNAVAPGFVASDIHAATLAAGPERAGEMYERTRQDMERAVEPTVAAGLVRFLLEPESDGITGRLISAPWDPWREPDAVATLAAGDFGRLRRVDGHRVRER
jgi:NAD(P)-dependent dehydrogenase (short-subunit alcohol dehydrogenase family)